MADKPRKSDSSAVRQRFEFDLELLRIKVDELKVLMEQYFVDAIAFPPEKEHNSVKQLIFRLSGSNPNQTSLNFKLKQIVSRYNSYNTYWTRVLRQRESGSYHKDKFKAKLRAKAKSSSPANTPELAKLKQQERKNEAIYGLFEQYAAAVKSSGGNPATLSYGDFKESIIDRSKRVKKNSGGAKLRYRIVENNGGVSVQIDSA